MRPHTLTLGTPVRRISDTHTPPVVDHFFSLFLPCPVLCVCVCVCTVDKCRLLFTLDIISQQSARKRQTKQESDRPPSLQHLFLVPFLLLPFLFFLYCLLGWMDLFISLIDCSERPPVSPLKRFNSGIVGQVKKNVWDLKGGRENTPPRELTTAH